MRTRANPKPLVQVEKTTWYYMSNKLEQLLFGLSNPHFVARAGRMHTSIVTDGTTEDMNRINEQQIPTSGTVVEMIELFIEGATISFPEPRIAKIAYERILAHLDVHIKAAREDKMYEAPDPEFFQYMTEFAMSIRGIAMVADPDIDNPGAKKSFRRTHMALPRFSDAIRQMQETEEQAAEEVVPAPLRRLDSVERYLRMIGNGN